MEEKKIKIEKIVLNIHGQEVALSVEEAKSLQAALNDVWKPPAEIHWYPIPSSSPPYYYYNPIVPPPIDLTPRITCVVLGSEE